MTKINFNHNTLSFNHNSISSNKNNSKIKTNLMFIIVLKGTKTSNTIALFYAIDLVSLNIIKYKLHNGLTYTKAFKSFIINTISSTIKNNDICKVYIPSLAKSSNLIYFIETICDNVDINFYISSSESISPYKEIYNKIKLDSIKADIKNQEDLFLFILNFNNVYKYEIKNVKIFNTIGIRHYSTSRSVLNKNNINSNDKIDKSKYG
jgi:hypothetical protein